MNTWYLLDKWSLPSLSPFRLTNRPESLSILAYVLGQRTWKWTFSLWEKERHLREKMPNGANRMANRLIFRDSQCPRLTHIPTHQCQGSDVVCYLSLSEMQAGSFCWLVERDNSHEQRQGANTHRRHPYYKQTMAWRMLAVPRSQSPPHLVHGGETQQPRYPNPLQGFHKRGNISYVFMCLGLTISSIPR